MRKGNSGERGERGGEKTDENSGHYVIASSRLPEQQPLERRTLVPIIFTDGGYLPPPFVENSAKMINLIFEPFL